MRSQTRKLLVALLALLIGGCSTGVPATPALTPATEAAPTASSTTVATATTVPSATPLPPTPTATASPTLTPIVARLHHARTQQLAGGQPVSDLFTAADGSLYLVDQQGGTHALAPDGSERWQYPKTAWLFALAPDDEQLYLFDRSPTIYALGRDGQLRWQFAGPQYLGDLPSIAPWGDLYLMVNNMSARNMKFRGDDLLRYSADGKELPLVWPDGFDAPFGLRLAFGPQNQLIAYNWQGFAVLEPDGKLLANCDSSASDEDGVSNDVPLQTGNIGGQPALFYVSNHDDLVARSLDCRKLWRLPLGTGRQPEDDDPTPPLISLAAGTAGKDYAGGQLLAVSLPAAQTSTTAGTSDLAIGPSGMLYVGRTDGGLLAVDPQGWLAWSTPPDERLGALEYIQESPGGQVYALGEKGYFLAVAPAGQDAWAHEFYAKGAAYAMHVLPDEVVMVQDGRLHFFNTDPAQQVEDPAPVPPASPDQARQDIEAFLLQHILTNGLDAPAGSYKVVDQPLWNKNPKQAALILREEPTQQAWWYANGELYPAKDPQQATDAFVKGYVDGYPTETWIVYRFKVLSVSEDGSTAEAELSWHCGGTCGQGRLLTLKRSQSGEWWVVRDVQTWIS